HPYFRFPYGSRDGRTLRLVHRLGYASVRWTVDTWGWMGLSQQSAGGAERRVMSNLVPGEIVLMHLGSARDHSTIDSKALPTVIRLVRARGYRFVTLAGIKAPARRYADSLRSAARTMGSMRAKPSTRSSRFAAPAQSAKARSSSPS